MFSAAGSRPRSQPQSAAASVGKSRTLGATITFCIQHTPVRSAHYSAAARAFAMEADQSLTWARAIVDISTNNS
jgi:hypothetical protein